MALEKEPFSMARRTHLPPDENYEYDISRNAAAKLIGVSPRTIIRMVARGELDRNHETDKLSSAQCKEWLEAVEGAGIDEEGERSSFLKEINEAFKQSTDHNERLLKLLEGPMQSALSTVANINQALMKRLTDQEETHLENMKQLGEFLLAKEERQSLIEDRRLKAQNMGHVMTILEKATPMLLAQMSGSGKLKEFFDALNEDEKNQIADLAHYFDTPKKKKLFSAALETVGVKVPEKPADTDEPREATNEQA